MNSRWAARVAVGGLHAALLLALLHHRVPMPERHREAHITTVRLLPPPARPSPSARPQQQPPVVKAPTPVLPPRPTPSADSPPAEPAAAAPAPAEAATTEPPRTTLRLTLPPGYAASTAAARNPALSDERSNTRRPRFEDKIADAAGATGDWVSERTSDHRTLLRRGDTCVEVLRSRIADSDPFNNSVAPRTVPMFGKPYKCK